MSGFTHSTSWSGQRLTVGVLRQLAEAAKDMAPGDPVEVSVEPTYPSPTDPGGQIRIRINRTERQEQ